MLARPLMAMSLALVGWVWPECPHLLDARRPLGWLPLVAVWVAWAGLGRPQSVMPLVVAVGKRPSPARPQGLAEVPPQVSLFLAAVWVA